MVEEEHFADAEDQQSYTHAVEKDDVRNLDEDVALFADEDLQ